MEDEWCLNRAECNKRFRVKWSEHDTHPDIPCKWDLTGNVSNETDIQITVDDVDASVTLRNFQLKFKIDAGLKTFETFNAKDLLIGPFVMVSKKNIHFTLTTEFSYFSWYAWYMVLVYVNALLGLILFEI